MADPDALLAQIHEDAKARIKELADLQPLTDAQKMDLAEQLTILANSGEGEPSSEILNFRNEMGTNEYDNLVSHNIQLYFGDENKGYSTIVYLDNGREILDWGDGNEDYSPLENPNLTTHEDIVKAQLRNVNFIKKIFN